MITTDLKKLIKEISEDVYFQNQKDATRQAVIVDTKDPEKKGRVKIRVSGVHSSELPEDQLPWVQVAPLLGSNQGIGNKLSLQKGQFAEVKALTSGLSEWIVTNGSSIVRKELNSESNKDEDGQPFSSIINDVLEMETLPKIVSTDLSKLQNTVYGLIMAKLLSEGYGDSDPDFPEFEFLKITSKPIDLTDKHAYYHKENNLGNLNKWYYYYNENPNIVVKNSNKLNTAIELLNAEEIKGYELDGSISHPRIENNELIIPPNIYYGESQSSYKDYELKYKVTDKENVGNTSENKITIRIAGLDYKPELKQEVIKETTPEIQKSKVKQPKPAETVDYAYDEYPPESEKGETEKKNAIQLPNGISIEWDGTEDNDDSGRNAMVSIKHPEGSRIDMFDDGRMIVKSADSTQFQQEKNLLINTGNVCTLSAKNYIQIKVPKLYIEGENIDIDAEIINYSCNELNITCNDMNIKGDLNITGNINQEGNQQVYGNINVTGGDVVADGVSLKNHTHSQQKDSNGDSQVNTDKPIQ